MPGHRKTDDDLRELKERADRLQAESRLLLDQLAKNQAALAKTQKAIIDRALSEAETMNLREQAGESPGLPAP